MLAAKISPRTKVLALNSPHNPTGGVLTRDDLETIARLAIENDVTVDLRRDLQPERSTTARSSPLPRFDGMRDRTIVLDGFSKAYAMTGWRLGYGVMPAEIAKTVASDRTEQLFVHGDLRSRGRQSKRSPGPDERRHRRWSTEFRVSVATRSSTGLNSIARHHAVMRPDGAFYAFANVSARRRPTIANSRRSFSKKRTLPDSPAIRLRRGGSRATCASRTRTRSRTSRLAIERMRAVLPRFPELGRAPIR